MLNIEDLNRYDFSDVLRQMKKYVDITINNTMESQIYEALDTIKVEEIIIFLKQYNIDDFKYRSKDFINILSIYLNEKINFIRGYINILQKSLIL
ncbi:hypothetical protein [Silvanigrella sp.]|jgi:hypothetical protein|uniref:hypothetical protein n=1 Tax=Silvanigrella sp. TaxID=2024976 RepID=UPI0037C56967